MKEIMLEIKSDGHTCCVQYTGGVFISIAELVAQACMKDEELSHVLMFALTHVLIKKYKSVITATQILELIASDMKPDPIKAKPQEIEIFLNPPQK